MAKWFDEAIDQKIREAGNHMILVPARNPNAPIDTVDIYDGVTGKFIAADVPEEDARKFTTIWNKLVDEGETTASISLSWFVNRKCY